MPWVPINESSYTFNFTAQEGVELNGALITANGVSSTSFSLDLIEEPPEPPLFQVTVQSYEAGSEFGDVGGAYFAFNSELPQELVTNAFPPANPQTGFSPANMGGQARSIAYAGAGGSEWTATETFQFLVAVWEEDAVSYNCECDDPNPSRTLAELRTELMVRLGFSAQTASPPPGMLALLDSFLQGAQRMLYRQYRVLRTERFFTWVMVPGVRFYDLAENADECIKELDPRMITWVGLSDGDECWRPLICGIPPECYTRPMILGWPERYEIRQCIEVWPAPNSDQLRLRIKGHFGLEPFVEDTDQCTIDDEAVFLFALARAKAHYRHPDAKNYQTDAQNYIRFLTSGAHQTRRYVPGDREWIAPAPPLWIPKEY